MWMSVPLSRVSSRLLTIVNNIDSYISLIGCWLFVRDQWFLFVFFYFLWTGIQLTNGIWLPHILIVVGDGGGNRNLSNWFLRWDIISNIWFVSLNLWLNDLLSLWFV